MEPIILTEFDDTLILRKDCCDEGDNFDSLSKDDFGIYIGRHNHNEPILSSVPVVYVRRISTTYFVLWCACCGRICEPIPMKINTFSELRQWCKEQIVKKRAGD